PALFGHQAAEALFVDAEAGLGRHLECQFQWEAVGVVQRERVRARQHGGPRGLRGARGILEQSRTRCQGAIERGFLGDRDAVDPVEVGDEFGVRRPHRVAHRRHQVADDRVVDTEQLGRADHATQQSAQHIAAAVVAGTHPVADQDRGGATVVGDDPVPDVVLVVADVVAPWGHRGYRIYDRTQQIGLVNVVYALQQERHPFDAHAGVDVLPWQRAEDLVALLGRAFAPLVLHEHEIPDLDVAVLVGDGAALDTEFGAAVVVDLRRRAAGAWDAHRPVVVGHAAALNSLGRQPG